MGEEKAEAITNGRPGMLYNYSETPHPNFKKNLCLSSQEKGWERKKTVLVTIASPLGEASEQYNSAGATICSRSLACYIDHHRANLSRE